MTTHVPQETALRDQFCSIAGQTFDFALAFVGFVARQSALVSACPTASAEFPLTTVQAARRLGVAVPTFREMVRTGKVDAAVILIPSAYGSRPMRRFSAAAIDAMVAERPRTSH